MAIGLRRLHHDSRELAFAIPVDVAYSAWEGSGTLYAQGAHTPKTVSGFRLQPWVPIGEERWKTLNTICAVFIQSQIDTTAMEVGHEG